MRIQVLKCQQGKLREAVVSVSGGLNSFGCQAHRIVETVQKDCILGEDLSLLSYFLKLHVHNMKGYRLMQEQFLVSCITLCPPCQSTLSILLH